MHAPSSLERAIPEKVAAVLLETGREAEIVPEDILSIADMSLTNAGDRLIVTVMVSLLSQAEEEEIYFGVPSSAQSEKGMVKTPMPVRIVFSLFPEVESLCGLDINRGLPNEIITVREEADTFIIESRRFGHGVGMSQRGAQRMAGAYQKTWREILAFYYPGMVLQDDGLSPVPTPTAVSDHFLISPGPPATPTPRPTLMPVALSQEEGLYTVSVVNISANSYLNLRSEPTINGVVLRQLYYGQPLVVLEECADSWLHVKTDSAEGYVMASFVERLDPQPPTPGS